MKRMNSSLLAGMLVVQAVLASGLAFLSGEPVRATPASGIVISQVYVGDKTSPRLIEIYNNTTHEIDVTNWCVRYATASSGFVTTATSVRACFTAATPAERLYMAPSAYIVIGAGQLALPTDYVMTEGLGSGVSGKVYVTDNAGVVVDAFTWGSVASPTEGQSKPVSPTKVYERRLVTAGIYQDTGDSAADFMDGQLRSLYVIGGIVSYEDVCTNIDGLQSEVPDGYEAGDIGQCAPMVVDICGNIEGVQVELPANTARDAEGVCYEDVCSNLPEFQAFIPEAYSRSELGQCYLTTVPLQVTELFPNPPGEDKGAEFIEFYNPNEQPVDLTNYLFYLNGDYQKPYHFPTGGHIAAKSYLVITGAEVPFVLTNSAGSLRLASIDGSQITDVDEYQSADAGESWLLWDGGWTYSSKPTPGMANVMPPVQGKGSAGASVVALADCGEGRERNPVTNRCRAVSAVVTASLQPCKEGQYRSEETNRCRSIATAAASVLKPCADNQYRNPLTNRCRKIADADEVALADCGEGRERNPTTNRCRNVLAVASVPKAAFAVEPVRQGAEAFVGWWALGGVVLLALGYAAWEWRVEVGIVTQRMAAFLRSGK